MSKSFLVGIATDAADGHTRITRGDGMHLQGGSEDTHTILQEIGIKVQEQAASKGKRLPQCDLRELRDFVEHATDKVLG